MYNYNCTNFICKIFSDVIQLVKSKQDTILQCLPTDYEKTLQVLQDHLTDEQICCVLSNSDHASANRAILNCLTENLNCSENLLEFCDHIEKILPLSNDQGPLTSVITEVRTSTYMLQQ